jgi:segregation and condensation protein B
MPDVAALAEAVLFAAGEPVSMRELIKALEMESADIQTGLEALGRRLDSTGSGLQLVEIAGGWQLSTRPDCSTAVGRMLSPRANRLSKPALETVTIVAYRQPVTQSEVEAIRGVACDGVLRTLVERELIEEQGRKATPGRPILYGTTSGFLHYFGLADIESLPPLPEDSDPEADAAAVKDAVGAAGLDA